MNLKNILNAIIFWRKWTRKISKPLLTDDDFKDIELDIDEQLHVHEPAVYKLKRKHMKRKPC